MFDINSINKRHFGVKFGNVSIEVEPPKLKVLKRFAKLQKIEKEESTEELIDIMCSVLSKNKTGYKITAELIEENFDTDDMFSLLTVYFNWVGEVNNNPN